MAAMTGTTSARLLVAVVIAAVGMCACTGAPSAPLAPPTVAPQVQQARTLPTPSPIPATATPAPGFTPEVSQRNGAGVPLPRAPGAVNVVVTYTPVPSGTPLAESGLIDVSVGDNYFYPQEVRITVGSTVEWDYNGGGGETESIHNVIGPNGLFSSGDLNPNSRFAFTFEQPGQFDYVCSYHARQMTGTITVQ